MTARWDGTLDRDMISVTDLGRDTNTVYRDLGQNGDASSRVTSAVSADGLQRRGQLERVKSGQQQNSSQKCLNSDV